MSTDLLIFALGRDLYEARIREAWGVLAQQRIDKLPWPKHMGAERAADHDLAIAQAKMLMKRWNVTPKEDPA